MNRIKQKILYLVHSFNKIRILFAFATKANSSFLKITVNKEKQTKFDFRFNYCERIAEITKIGLREIINQKAGVLTYFHF